MILEIVKMWNRIIVKVVLTFPVNLRWFRFPRSLHRHDKRLPLDTWNQSGVQENIFWKSMFYVWFTQRSSSKNSIWRRAKKQRGSPWAGKTKTIHTSEDRRSEDTIPMPTFATTQFDYEFHNAVASPLNYMVVQQRQQISELQLNKFPIPQSFLAWIIRFKNQVTTCSDFPSDAVLWIK